MKKMSKSNALECSIPVLILGMHRSGTSCLAGSLEQAGLYLGQVNTKAPHNAKGNRENRDIMDLNDSVLALADATWDHPPKGEITWTQEQIETRDALIATYPTDKKWGFKEPRTMFTFEGWLDAFPQVQVAATFRHPLSVAQSLNIRNKFPIEQGLQLWRAYNERLLTLSQMRKVEFICFDWTPEEYGKALVELSEKLGL